MDGFFNCCFKSNKREDARKVQRPELKQPEPSNYPEKKSVPLLNERKGVLVCALYDFEPSEENELRFQRDDILKVIDNYTDPWQKAENTRTHKVGLIPHNYVTKDTTIAGALSAWNPVTRVEAEKRLLTPGTEPGTFIIRPSRVPDIYALSVRTLENEQVRIRHFKIYHYGDQPSFYLDEARVFPQMNKLIEFYRENPLTDGCSLTQPFEREKPQAPFQDAELNRSMVNLTNLIDRGNFGEVWLGQIQSVKVAVKKPLHTAAKEDFLREAKKMHAIWHPQLVQFLGVCTKPESEPILILTEFMENGSLSKYLPSEEGRKLVLLELLLIMDQVASGMCYLESIEFVHRDLRAANVFVGNNLQIKVGDFGQSKMMSMPSNTPLDIKTPICWSSPEALVNENEVTSKSDVWQYGILGYEVFTYGGRPYSKYPNNQEVVKAIRKGEVLERPQKCPEPFYRMMLSCWKFDPAPRPTFRYLKNELEDLIETIDNRYVPDWASAVY